MEDITVGIIGGTNILYIDVLENVEEKVIETPYGSAEVDVGEMYGHRVALIRRHGRKHNKPPHVINHPANMAALKQLGVKSIVAMSSTGALKTDMKIPSLAVPHDYISFFSVPTIYNDQLVHITPKLDERIRSIIIENARAVAKEHNIPLYERGIYFQTIGPRLETRAEVQFMAAFADLAGMTMASEATVAQELGIRYAALCTVDNMAHGLGTPPDYRKIKESAKEMASIALEVVAKSVEVLLNDNTD